MVKTQRRRSAEIFRNSPKIWLYIIGVHDVSVILHCVQNDKDGINYNSQLGFRTDPDFLPNLKNIFP